MVCILLPKSFGGSARHDKPALPGQSHPRVRRSGGLLAICLVALALPSLPAADFYWNGVGSAGSAGGGSGTWDTTLTNWETAASGGTATNWPATPSGNDDAFFGGTAGTVTVDAGGVDVNDITFSTAGYTVSGGTITLGGTTPTITNAVAATISAPLAGSAGLGKAGAGTLTLSAANSYTGMTTITAGTLALSGGANRLAPAGVLSFSGSGSLDVGGGSQTLSNLTLAFGAANGTATLTGGSLVLDGASALNVTPSTTTGGITATVDASGLASLVISKAGQAITVGGLAGGSVPGNNGRLTLSSTSNTITAASMNVGTTGGANAAGVLNSGRLDLGSANVINAPTWKLGTTRDGGIVAFQAGLTNPTATLRAADGTSRVTSITVGENAAGSTAVGTSHLDFSGGSVDLLVTDLILSRGGSGSTTSGPAVNGSFSMGGGAVDATRIWLSRNDSGGANSTNTSSFTQSGGTVTVGTLTFAQTTASTATPTFNSQYTLGNGTLKAATISAGTGTFSTSTIRRINFNGGTLTHYDASTDLTLNGVAGTGGSIGIVLGTTGSPTILADTGRTVTIGANTAITGSGSLTKTGAGGLVLNGSGGFTGDTRITGGTLTLGNSTALSGSTLDMNAADSGAIAFDTITSVTLGGLEGSRAINFQNTAAQVLAVTIGQNNQSTSYGGQMTGASSIRKLGTGSLVYGPGAAHTVTLAGLNVSGGTLEVTSGRFTVTGSAATGQPDGLTGFVVSRGGTFRLNGGTIAATGGSYVFTAGNTGGIGSTFILDSGSFDGGTREVLNAYGSSGTFTINGGTFTAGEFRISQSAPGMVNVNGGTLAVTKLKYSNNTAVVNFDGGTLQARASVADLITTNVAVNVKAGGAVIDSNGFAVTIPEALLADSSSAGGGLEKTGAGTLTLTASNTFTGLTAVTAGTLALSGSGSLASGGNVRIDAAARFDRADVSQTLGDVTVNGSVAASSGLLTVNGALAGTGTVGGATTIAGILAPGNSIGLLTLDGAATMNSGSRFAWEIDPTETNPETARGTAFDGLNAGSTFAGTGSVFEIVLPGTNDFADPFWQQNRVWTTIVTEFDGSTPVSGWAAAFGGGFAYAYNGQTAPPDAYGSFSLQDSTLTWTAVPEPGTTGLAALAVLAGLLHRRWRDGRARR